MMYAHEPLPQVLWAELINTAAYILNRTGPTSSDKKSPYELWYGKKPIIKYLQIIGSTAYVHIPKQKLRKLDKKAIKGRLIGYDEDCYRIWVTDGKQSALVRSRDVIFDEKPLPICNSEIPKTEVETREYPISITPNTNLEREVAAPEQSHVHEGDTPEAISNDHDHALEGKE